MKFRVGDILDMRGLSGFESTCKILGINQNDVGYARK